MKLVTVNGVRAAVTTHRKTRRVWLLRGRALKGGGWLCCLSSPRVGEDLGGGLPVARISYSELVARSRSGGWSCSCGESGCAHAAAARAFYEGGGA